MPIYTHRRHLPATKINYCNISQSLAAEGSIITNATISNSVIGIRSIIESGAHLEGVITMGASEYETPEEKQRNLELNRPNIGIGSGTRIKRAIIDKDCRIGNDCHIGVDDIERKDGNYGDYHIRDEIIVIAKNKTIPSGTRI
jgi:glucose-1-phosphate adenylyltransferase